jgi:hypothetical protein
MLPAWLLRRRRTSMQHPIMTARRSSAPSIEPMTIPAMAPPLSPEPPRDDPAAAPLVALDPAVDDVIAPMDVVTGNLTFVHRVSACALMQHESVELGELVAQYEQRLGRLFAKPQLFGSFSTPAMHDSLFSESAGNAQTVKSARIWLIALLPVLPHRSCVEAICSSLVANAAC